MNILIACDFDNGGQMFALYRALNKYTEHIARLITFRETFLQYETDVFNPTPNTVGDMAAWADFFIMGEFLTPNIQSLPIINRLTPNNCIIRAAGSLARSRPDLYAGHIMKTGGFHDPTLASKIYPFGITVNMGEFEEWPQASERPDYPVKIVFSGTPLKHRKEHSGIVFDVWERLGKKYNSDMVEFVNISMKTWNESLRIKSSCHILFDQYLLGTYANSAIEGMFYKMPVFGYNSAWSRSIFPDSPIINITDPEELFTEVCGYIDDPLSLAAQGAVSYKYVIKTHHSRNAIARWVGLIEYVTKEYRKNG